MKFLSEAGAPLAKSSLLLGTVVMGPFVVLAFMSMLA